MDAATVDSLFCVLFFMLWEARETVAAVTFGYNYFFQCRTSTQRQQLVSKHLNNADHAQFLNRMAAEKYKDKDYLQASYGFVSF